MASNVARWSAVPPAPGQLLVAAPILIEDTFARTVLYLLEHDESGSAAVVLNRASRTPVGQVLPDWHDIASDPAVVFSGGPAKDLNGIYDEARAIRDGGANGSIIGRNTFQRPREEAMAMLDQIIKIYQDKA